VADRPELRAWPDAVTLAGELLTAYAGDQPGWRRDVEDVARSPEKAGAAMSGLLAMLTALLHWSLPAEATLDEHCSNTVNATLAAVREIAQEAARV